MLLKAKIRAVNDSIPPPFYPRQCCPPLRSGRQTPTASGTQYLLSKQSQCYQRVDNTAAQQVCSSGVLNNTQAIDPDLNAPVSGNTAGDNPDAGFVPGADYNALPSQVIQQRRLDFTTGINVYAATARNNAGSEVFARRREAAGATVVLQPWQQPAVQFPPCPLSQLTQEGVPIPATPPCIPGGRVVA